MREIISRDETIREYINNNNISPEHNFSEAIIIFNNLKKAKAL